MSDIVERLSANVNWLMRDGFETSAKNVQCALAEIEFLRQQLRDVTDHYHAALEAAQVRFRQLAASQAREAQLREALEDANDFVERYSNRWDGINGKHPYTVVESSRKALALPQDTTALEVMIAEAGEAMRERTVGVCLEDNYDLHGYIPSIRALPGVTMEDLQ